MHSNELYKKIIDGVIRPHLPGVTRDLGIASNSVIDGAGGSLEKGTYVATSETYAAQTHITAATYRERAASSTMSGQTGKVIYSKTVFMAVSGRSSAPSTMS